MARPPQRPRTAVQPRCRCEGYRSIGHQLLRLCDVDAETGEVIAAITLVTDNGGRRLRGVVTDQSELHDLLAKVRDLGVTLISVTPTNAAHDADSQQQQHR